MFKNDVKDMKEIETIVGPSVKVKGDFHGSGNIVVEGMVEGNLKSDNAIAIKDKAKVIADVKAKDAVVGGEVHGNLKIEGYLEVTNTAKIFGDIEAGSISIAKGAVFNGNCVMGSKAAIKKEAASESGAEI